MTCKSRSPKTKSKSGSKVIISHKVPGMAKRVPGHMGRTVPDMKW